MTQQDLGQKVPPLKQRTDEWEKLDSSSLRYHTKQWDTPKQSTKAFDLFAHNKIIGSKNIIDLGCGAGASTAYLAQRYNNVSFTGFDYVQDLITLGAQISQNKNISNLHFEQGDWFDIKPTNKFDGVISFQTLSWLPEFEKPLLEIFKKLKPRWIALNSLFYEGDITCHIEVEEHRRNRKSFYNVYSIPAIKRLCKENGYTLTKISPFEMDIDIEKPAEIDFMATYTKRIYASAPPRKNNFERLQISGPLLMTWYMLLIEQN
jgi:trans-aconitate methyltransferase